METLTYHQLFSASPSPIALIENGRKIIKVANPAMLLVWKADESILNKPYNLVLSSERGADLRKYLATAERTGEQCVHLGCKIEASDDVVTSEAYYNFTYTPVRDSHGTLKGIMICGADITDQCMLKNELLAERELCQAAIDSAELGIFDHNLNSGEIIWDKRTRSLLGVMHQLPVTAQDFINAVHPEDRSEIKDRIQMAKKKHISQGCFFAEYRTIGLQYQNHRWIRASGKVFFDEEEVPCRIVGTVQDITLERAEHEQKNKFIAMVSHELKTPLTSLKAYLQLTGLRSGMIGDQILSDILAKAEAQINKMNGIINSFLNVARLDSGKLGLNCENIHLFSLVKKAVAEHQDLFPSYQFDFFAEVDVFVFADPEKINQVVTNLLNNAVKFSPFEKTIKITCEQSGNEAIVKIKDQGIGVSQDELSSIFKLFHRVPTGNNKHISGFGIGLYICHQLVKMHEGKIWAENDPEKGSVFAFSLPVLG